MNFSACIAVALQPEFASRIFDLPSTPEAGMLSTNIKSDPSLKDIFSFLGSSDAIPN